MNIKDFIKKHIEIIASLFSGATILTAWILTDTISTALFISLHIIAFIIGGYAQAKEGILDTIENKDLNVELLMVIAAIGAASIGYWTEGAILIFIFSLAGALETYTLNKSNAEISSLMNLQPEEAVLLDNNIEKIIPIDDLNIGDLVLVKASERIPADGIVVQGITSVDESAITGESLAHSKSNGSEVFAGTVALDGTITIKVTKMANETIFQKIINMVQSAQEEKPPTQLFIEKFEGLYVKIVLATVILVMFIPYLFLDWTLTESIYRAMILLVVASPCALVASIMPATLSAISQSARNGVLFKGGVHLENMQQIDLVAFDKTGTLTQGKPVVTDFFISETENKTEILEIIGVMESESTHPLAKSIITHNLNILAKEAFDIEISNLKTVSGNGITSCIVGDVWKIGNAEFVGHENAFAFQNGIAKELAQAGKTIVFASKNDVVVALYGLQDVVRKEAIKAIQALKAKGIRTVMLTGDNELTAKVVADQVGLDDYVAECMPDEKLEYIRKYRAEKYTVAMVGDGINDAPALALADLGIAIGDGTDVALETADVVLMKNDLFKLTNAISLSKKMNRIIKQNIVFSLLVIASLIAANFFQVIDMPLGVIGHEGSTILVILNGLRLLR